MDWSTMWHDAVHMDISVYEKVLRTVLVYGGLVILVRIAGKRVLSQLNTFDLVVVLLLANVVQNAVIGPDNSVLGGLLGAAVLVAINAVWERIASSSAFVQRLVAGSTTRLVSDGEPDLDAITRVGLRLPEVMAVLHRQGADRIEDVRVAELAPNGAITMELTRNAETASYADIQRAVEELSHHLDQRLAELEQILSGPRAGTRAAAAKAATSPLGAPPVRSTRRSPD